MFGPKIKKYLVLNCNDSPKAYYKSRGSFSGMAKCPENHNKVAEVASTVLFSLDKDIIKPIRIECAGPPALTAAGNFVVEQSKNQTIERLIECSRVPYIANALEINLELANIQGIWAIEKAVDLALTCCNNLNIE